jgi:AcrB/AcrD/AcrF family
VIQRLVHFALHQRFITVALALLLTTGGVVAFSRLPIEAYPDVVDVEVDVITIWPGYAHQVRGERQHMDSPVIEDWSAKECPVVTTPSTGTVISSEHPPARVVMRKARDSALLAQEPDEFNSFPGKGVRGVVGPEACGRAGCRPVQL